MDRGSSMDIMCFDYYKELGLQEIDLTAFGFSAMVLS